MERLAVGVLKVSSTSSGNRQVGSREDEDEEEREREDEEEKKREDEEEVESSCTWKGRSFACAQTVT